MSYSIQAGCTNCGFGLVTYREVAIPQGRKVEEMPCPNCGCKALYRKSAH